MTEEKRINRLSSGFSSLNDLEKSYILRLVRALALAITDSNKIKGKMKSVSTAQKKAPQSLSASKRRFP